ncbi:MAG: hypothetical protein JWM04_1545 [Verrucomicrobiales bacterium]|nr:hypothetical protein [Verrucomicrobiales bacterium]
MNAETLTLSQNTTSVVLFRDGVFIARVQLPGQSAPSDIALHGVKTEVEAAEVCNRFNFLRTEPALCRSARQHEDISGAFTSQSILGAGFLVGCSI